MFNIQNIYDKLVKRIKSVKDVITNDFYVTINEVILYNIENKNYIKFVKKFIFCL